MYGEIMQFTSFVGVGDIGMAVADQSYQHVPSLYPYRSNVLVQRMSQTELYKYEQTYGLQFPETYFENPPVLSYLHYRWPRYEYKTDERELTIQWMVYEGIVLQQCIVRTSKTLKRKFLSSFERGA